MFVVSTDNHDNLINYINLKIEDVRECNGEGEDIVVENVDSVSTASTNSTTRAGLVANSRFTAMAVTCSKGNVDSCPDNFSGLSKPVKMGITEA